MFSLFIFTYILQKKKKISFYLFLLKIIQNCTVKSLRTQVFEIWELFDEILKNVHLKVYK